MFAWYLYLNFGNQPGRNVEIVAHSMGGLIVRAALYLMHTSVQSVTMPPTLGNISDVITFETPHGGEWGAGVPCGDCAQGTQIDPASNFMNDMANLGQDPQAGANGTDWTLFGSDSDPFFPSDKATFMDGGHKAYYVCDFDISITGNPIPKPWCYNHCGVLTDESDAYDAHIKFCDGCPRTPSAWNEETGIAPHSLHSMFYALWNAPRVDNVHGGGAFFDKGQQTGGVQGPLGGPITNWYTIPGGQEQDFQVGSIYWSAATGTVEVQGAIHGEYLAMQGPGGILGFPVQDEGPVAAGRVSYFAGNHCGSFSGPNGSGSAIYWSPSTGAWQVGGCIYRRYLQSDLNGPSGQLGFPISNVTQLSNTYVSYFAGNACAGGGPVINGRVSGSAVYSNSLGTFYVAGCIYHNWQQSWGGPTGFLGLPISDVMPITLGSTGGYVSFFVGTNCGSGAWQGSTSAIYSSPRGTFEVHGCIYQQYRQFTDDGGNTLFFDLGFPTSNEVGVTSGFSGVAARTNSFEHGAIYWTPTSGALEVHGAIYAAYQQQFNGAAGALGLPTTNEFFNQQGQAESDFENGFITYDFSTHQTSVTVFPPVG